MNEFLRSVSPSWLILYAVFIAIGVFTWIRVPLSRPVACEQLPQGVSTFSWPAFLVPVIWPFAYRRPELAFKTIGVLLAAGLPSVVPALVMIDLWSSETTISPGVYLALAVTGVAFNVVANVVAMLYSGSRAHLVYWCDSSARLDPDDFLRRQRKWLLIGAMLSVIWIASLPLQVASRMSDVPYWAL